MPRVSLGLPVYNGENYLRETLESLLGQTFRDFEVVISDNASTDATAAICREFEERDSRIRVLRNERNLGAAPNYNRTYAESRAPLFKWAAHDDLIAPTYLEKCVAVMDADPDVVLCQSLVRFIGPDGGELSVYDSDLAGSDAARASDRFAALILRHHFCTEFFGLIRKSKLEGTILHGDFPGGDRALLAELALRGRYAVVPEPLFMNRDHPGRYVRAVARGDQAGWHSSENQGGTSFHHWRLYREYVAAVRRHVPRGPERMRCLGHLARWWTVNSNGLEMAAALVTARSPKTYEALAAVGRKLPGVARTGILPGSRVREGGE